MTMSSILAGFASYLLSHPDNASKQAKLVAEVDAFGRDRDPTVEDLDTLPYLDGVIKEALRLFPPAYLTTRMAEDTFELAGTRPLRHLCSRWPACLLPASCSACPLPGMMLSMSPSGHHAHLVCSQASCSACLLLG